MKFPLSIIAGVVQAAGSVLAKLAFSSDSMVVAAFHRMCLDYDHASEHKQEICSGVALLVRGIILVVLVVLNSGGLVLSVRGMSQVGSFLGTVLTTAANLMATAVLGAVVFGEVLSLTWWAGASCIATGVILLNPGKQEKAVSEAPVHVPEEAQEPALELSRHKKS